jgi:hypothetical protein
VRILAHVPWSSVQEVGTGDDGVVLDMLNYESQEYR